MATNGGALTEGYDMSDTSKVLYGAADHIARFGHHKGDGFASDNVRTAAACTIGAIVTTANQTFGPFTDRSRAARASALLAVESHLGTDYIVPWNDAPERTAAEVIEVLRATAVIEAAREEATVEVSVGPKPGDLCRILAGGLIEHHGCDQHRDGVVTNVRTGEVEVSA